MDIKDALKVLGEMDAPEVAARCIVRQQSKIATSRAWDVVTE